MMKHLLFAAAVAAQAVQGTPATHELPLQPQHVHWGYYDTRPPALHMASGDRVRVEN
jgi:hypothetical protein